MQSDTWGGIAQLTPNRPSTNSHHRESSLSSLGSTGPASPYSQNTSNPEIALTDTGLDGACEMHIQDYANNQPSSYYHLAKSFNPASHAPYHQVDGSISDMGYHIAAPGLEDKFCMETGLLPAPELPRSYTKLQVSDAISSTRPEFPFATANEGEKSHRRKNDCNNVPKLDRTMTDVYGDELYNPNFSITSTSPPRSRSATSVGSDIFSQRINAANHQHLSAAQSPASTGSRARSPFRTSSPFSTSPARGFAVPRYPTSQQWTEHDHAHGPASQSEGPVEPETPKTISPKDAVLELNETETDWPFPLFPQDAPNSDVDALSKTMNAQQSEGAYVGSSNTNETPRQAFGYQPSQIPTGISVLQQYPFIAHPTASQDSPPRLSSSGASSLASGNNTPTGRRRPPHTGADSGTYTCTYHGCTLRFETPTLLQKHKREGHRQMQGLVAPRAPHESGMISNTLNSQAGPHRCDRLNPSTGKPCNTVFSRPYDLTRHEDTIHNARKQKVRCDLCTEEKTFSRADALTRHYRVCHPDMDLPGKTRRRRGGA